MMGVCKERKQPKDFTDFILDSLKDYCTKQQQCYWPTHGDGEVHPCDVCKDHNFFKPKDKRV